jgi:hypothetical protein
MRQSKGYNEGECCAPGYPFQSFCFLKKAKRISTTIPLASLPNSLVLLTTTGSDLFSKYQNFMLPM